MEIARSFLVTLFVWVLFATGASLFLRGEQQMNAIEPDYNRAALFESAYTGTADLARVPGEQVLGWVLQAKEGKFVLSLDGLLIDKNTKLDLIDLRGVSGITYTVQTARDASGRIVSITATH